MRSIRHNSTNEQVRGNRQDRCFAGRGMLHAVVYASSVFMRAARAALAIEIESKRLEQRTPAAPMPTPTTLGSWLSERIAILAASVDAAVANRAKARLGRRWLPVLCSSAVRS
jgi:hypothetical protein